MPAFFAKLTLLITLTTAVVTYEWWKVESRVQAFGPVHGSVEVAAKLIKLFRQVPAVEVVIAGDSKAERQINPNLFFAAGHPAINAASPSRDLWTWVSTMEAIGLNKIPKVFVISVGAYQINDGSIDKDTYTAELFFSLTPTERLTMFGADYFLAARKMLEAKPVYDNYVQIANQYSLSSGDYPELGYLRVGPSEYACPRLRHNSRSSIAPVYRNIKTDGARWRLFEEALRKLESWPGQYVLFAAPYSKKGRKCIDGSYGGDFEELFPKKVAAAVKDMKRVRFLDFYNQDLFLVDDGLYYDPAHLDERGADMFTRWWIDYLKREKLI